MSLRATAMGQKRSPGYLVRCFESVIAFAPIFGPVLFFFASGENLDLLVILYYDIWDGEINLVDNEYPTLANHFDKHQEIRVSLATLKYQFVTRNVNLFLNSNRLEINES